MLAAFVVIVAVAVIVKFAYSAIAEKIRSKEADSADRPSWQISSRLARCIFAVYEGGATPREAATYLAWRSKTARCDIVRMERQITEMDAQYRKEMNRPSDLFDWIDTLSGDWRPSHWPNTIRRQCRILDERRKQEQELADCLKEYLEGGRAYCYLPYTDKRELRYTLWMYVRERTPKLRNPEVWDSWYRSDEATEKAIKDFFHRDDSQ